MKMQKPITIRRQSRTKRIITRIRGSRKAKIITLFGAGGVLTMLMSKRPKIIDTTRFVQTGLETPGGDSRSSSSAPRREMAPAA